MSAFEKKFLSNFISNINNIIMNSPITSDSLVQDTPDAIVTDIVDKIEKSQNIKLYAVGKAADKIVGKNNELKTDVKTTDSDVENKI